MRTVLLIAISAVVLLTGCEWEDERAVYNSAGRSPLYFGPSPIEVRIANAEVIARVKLRSAELVAREIPAHHPSGETGYWAAVELRFDALEYLKGTGDSELVAYAYSVLDLQGESTPEKAKAAGSWLSGFRDKRWDDREAIVFLSQSEADSSYSIGRLGEFEPRPGERAVLKLTIAGNGSQNWLPDAAPLGEAATISAQYFLLEDPDTSTSTAALTISKSSLKAKIRALEAEITAAENSEAYRNCLRNRLISESMIQRAKERNEYLFIHRYGIDSGLSAHTIVDNALSGRLGDVLTADQLMGVSLIFHGPDAEFFEGVLPGIMHTTRPLPAGEYRSFYYLKSEGPNDVECGYYSHDYTHRHQYIVTVNAPSGTLTESFFDPYADGNAVTGTSTVGTIWWESGRVRASAADIPELPELYLDFIGLDGTTTLSLVVNDATRTADTVSWTVPTQPWSAGDRLMLRLRGTGCSGGVVVEDPVGNVALVGDCNTLLGARDTLATTGTLNWDVDTAMASWDGVTVGGTPSRVTELDLFNRQLGGTIPSELGALAGLERLALGFNGLTGVIPVELGALVNLRSLQLRYNALTGGIPAELGRLSNATVLWLQGNDLTGSIPVELGGMSALEDLGLAANDLTGSIPRELGGLTSLQRLWANENDLSGPIPPELGMLSSLTLLELDDNDLTGPVPGELGDLTDLKILRLSGNSFEGCIRPALRNVRTNDLFALGLPDCTEPGRCQ